MFEETWSISGRLNPPYDPLSCSVFPCTAHDPCSQSTRSAGETTPSSIAPASTTALRVDPVTYAAPMPRSADEPCARPALARTSPGRELALDAQPARAEPDQRIEPVQRAGKLRHDLREAIVVSNMRQLVQ